MIKSVIFDLDGVLINSEPVHIEAWKHYCNKNGLTISDAELQGGIGVYDGEAVRRWFGQNLSDKEVEIIVRDKFTEYYALISESFQSFPGAAQCIKALAENYTLGIASSEWRASIDLVTERLGVSKYFKAKCGKEDVSHHKPHPEIYIKMARLLKARPQKCAAIEDSIAGIRSAKAAGCRCIAITNSFPKNALLDAGADAVINSLEETAEIVRLLKSF